MSEDRSISQENTSEQARIFWENMAGSFQGRRRRGRAVVNTVVRDNSGRIVGALASIDGSIDQPLLIDHGQPLATGDVFLVENDGTVSLPQWRSIRKIQSVVAVPNAGEMPSLPTPTNMALYTGAVIGAPSLPVWAWIGASWSILDSARWGGHIDYELEYCDNEHVSDPEHLRINYQQSTTAVEVAITATDTIIPRGTFEEGIDPIDPLDLEQHDAFPFKGRISLGPERVSYEAISSQNSEDGLSGSGGDGTLTDTNKFWSTDEFVNHCLIDSAFNKFLITGNDAHILYFSGQAASGTYMIRPCFSGCTRGISGTTATTHAVDQTIVSESAGARFSGLAPGVTYNVRVRAIRFDGAVSGWTTWQSIVVHIDDEAPPTPWGLTARSSYSGVSLEWEGPTTEDTPDLVGFYIWSADDAAGTGEALYAVIGPRTEALISLPASTVLKYYCIQAVDSSGNTSARTERLPGRKHPGGGNNLLPNGDLEAPDPEIPDDWPALWAPTYTNVIAVSYGQHGIDGGKGWKFTVGSGGGQAIMVTALPILSGYWTIPAEIGQPYTLSFFYKLIVAEGVPTGPGYLFYVPEDYDAAEDGLFLISGKVASINRVSGGEPPLTTVPAVIGEMPGGWIRVQYTFEASSDIFNEDYPNIVAWVALASKSDDYDVTIVFDRIKLEIGSEATPWALGTFTPQGADALRIGPSAIMGGELHIQGDGSFKSDALPTDDQIQSLGKTDRRWKNIWCLNLYAENLIDMYGNALGGLIYAPTGTVYGGTGDCANITSPGADYNTVIGYEAMKFNETGDNNAVFGYQAGYGVTGKNYGENVIIGSQAGYMFGAVANYGNVVLGFKAAYSGAGNISENVIIGYHAAYDATSAYYNVIIGTYAGYGITIGGDNVYIGEYAGYNPAAGVDDYNVGIGSYAMYDIHDGEFNTAVGEQALTNITDGCYNAAIGAGALQALTTSEFNTAMGLEAGQAITVSSGGNSIFGAYAGHRLTTGYDNVLLGYMAGYWLTSATNSVFIGDHAGCAPNFDLAAAASNNVGVGSYSLYSLEEGSENTAVGDSSLTNLTDGYGNVAVGNLALASVTTGTFNVGVGDSAGYEITTGEGNICIGHYSGGLVATIHDGNVFIGHRAGYYADDPQGTTIVGYESGFHLSNLTTTGMNNSLFGWRAGYNLTSGGSNVFMGYQAAQAATSQSEAVVVGSQAAHDNTVIYGSIYIGYCAGYKDGGIGVFVGHSAGINTEDGEHIFIGVSAGEGSITSCTGTNNYGIGEMAHWAFSTGWSNVAVGKLSMGSLDTGHENVAVGHYSLRYNETGSYSVCMGYGAGNGVSGNSFSNNVLIGYYAGQVITTGGDHTCVGYKAGDLITSGTHCICIGENTDPPSATSTYRLNIGGTFFADLSSTKHTVGINVSNILGQLHVEQSEAAGARPVLYLDQGDDDQAFIHFQGTSAADQTKSISTVNGDGVVTGPKDYSSTAGWAFGGMAKMKLNGADVWVPYYTADTS